MASRAKQVQSRIRVRQGRDARPPARPVQEPVACNGRDAWRTCGKAGEEGCSSCARKAGRGLPGRLEPCEPRAGTPGKTKSFVRIGARCPIARELGKQRSASSSQEEMRMSIGGSYEKRGCVVTRLRELRGGTTFMPRNSGPPATPKKRGRPFRAPLPSIDGEREIMEVVQPHHQRRDGLAFDRGPLDEAARRSGREGERRHLRQCCWPAPARPGRRNVDNGEGGLRAGSTATRVSGVPEDRCWCWRRTVGAAEVGNRSTPTGRTRVALPGAR